MSPADTIALADREIELAQLTMHQSRRCHGHAARFAQEPTEPAPDKRQPSEPDNQPSGRRRRRAKKAKRADILLRKQK
jgi:hypothetical protein